MTVSMRSLACASLVAALVVATMNLGVSAQAADPFMGTWRLLVAKSTFSPGPAPKSGSVTISAAGADFKVVVSGVSMKDEKVQLEYTGNYNGKDFPLKVDVMGASISILSGSGQDIVARVDRPIPPQPFGVVRTVTTVYH